MTIDRLRSVTAAGAILAASVATPVVPVATAKSGPCRIESLKADASPVPLGVRAPEGPDGERATFLFSGMPESLSVSEASKINELWAVSGKQVAQAALVAPPGFRGKFSIRMQCLISGKQFEDTASVEIGGAPASQAEFENNPLMKQAASLMDDGDFARARLLLEHMARKGSAHAAFLLHQTYDADYLAERAAQGIAADAALAGKWLRAAQDLGYIGQNRELTGAPR
jgi:hypothetical protein